MEAAASVGDAASIVLSVFTGIKFLHVLHTVGGDNRVLDRILNIEKKSPAM